MQIINAYFKGFTYLKWVIFLSISCLVSVSLWNQAELFYYRHWPFEPLKVYNFRIVNPEILVRPGGQIIYEVDYEKIMPITPVIRRQIHNTFVHLYVDTYPPLKKCGRDVKQNIIPIPSNATPGEHILYWTATYFVGPERREISVTRSASFWVIEKEENGGPKGDTGKTGPKGEKGDNGKNFWGK